MTVAVDKLSLAGGEISRQLWPRQDLQKHASASKRVENMVVTVEGALTRRPGTLFVDAVKDEARPAAGIPFRYEGGDAYVLVLNGGVIRFYTAGGVVLSGGTPYEVAHPYGDGEISGVRFAQSGNVLYLAHGAHEPRILGRAGHTNWSLTPYRPDRGALDTPNTNPGIVVSLNDSQGTGKTMTASANIFVPAHVGTVWRIAEQDLSYAPLWQAGTTALPAYSYARHNGRVYVTVAGGEPGPNPPVHDEGSVRSGPLTAEWAYFHSGYGYVRVTGYTNAQTVTVDILSPLPASAVQTGGADSFPPHHTYRWTPPAWTPANGFPENVALRNNSLVWSRGAFVWVSQPNAFLSFEVTNDDASSLQVRLRAPDGSSTRIEWMLFSGVLLLGAQDGEWILRGPNPYDALTVANVISDFNKTDGSRPHRPAVVDGGAVYIGRSGTRLHFAEFDRLGETLAVEDTTKFARHILRGRAAQVVYQRDPHRLIWVRDDTGRLFCLTWYLREQVVGWTRIPLRNGVVETMAVIPSPDGSWSQLWLVVRRTVAGQTRRYVELMQPFFEPLDEDSPTAQDAHFVDAGLRYLGGPVSTVSGLQHLEGQEVAVVLNGLERPRQTVAGGSLTLPAASGDVLVGLPITARVRPLPPSVPGSGSARMRQRRANHARVDLVDTAGGTIRVGRGQPQPIERSPPVSAPRPLVTAGLTVPTSSGHADELDVELTWDTAMPATLAGFSLDLEVGG